MPPHWRRRLTYKKNAELWGFAIYLASRDAYENSILPNGRLTGTPEQALDCACGLYLNDPTAWTPIYFREGPLRSRLA